MLGCISIGGFFGEGISRVLIFQGKCWTGRRICHNYYTKLFLIVLYSLCQVLHLKMLRENYLGAIFHVF